MYCSVDDPATGKLLDLKLAKMEERDKECKEAFGDKGCVYESVDYKCLIFSFINLNFTSGKPPHLRSWPGVTATS